MKFNSVFMLYSAILGFLAGLLSALFLTIVNLMIQLVWDTIPQRFDLPVYYPIIFGLIGGLLVGLFQRYVGDYPKTMEDTLEEFKATNAVKYKRQLSKNFIGALLVLTFGASLGPEAALASILGGLISWVGDRLKFTFARKEEFLKLGIGAMLATIFHAPLVGISTPFEEKLAHKSHKIKWRKLLLYGLSTIFGLIGFAFVQQLFPKEMIFKLRLPTVAWTKEVWLLILPAALLGIAFGYLFLALERLSDKIAEKIQQPVLLALLAGLCIGLFGMWSSYFLFSGEHELLGLSENYTGLTVSFLFLLAVGKALLTNLCFAFGWRGGKIFPAVFSSTALGLALASLFPYTPGLIVAIAVAASVTIILNQPAITAALLLFLFPLQFFPAIFLTCFAAQKIAAWLKSFQRTLTPPL